MSKNKSYFTKKHTTSRNKDVNYAKDKDATKYGTNRTTKRMRCDSLR